MYARTTLVGDGTSRIFSVPFPYINATHVVVKVNGVLKTLSTDYVWLTSSTIEFVTAPAVSAAVLILRDTPKVARLVNYQDAAVLREVDLDMDSDQSFYITQETLDWTDSNVAATAADLVLTHADVVLANADVALTHADVVLTHADVVLTHADVATANSVAASTTSAASTATTQASNASASASAASTSATNAGTSATSAATSATTATTQATSAATSASTATTQASNASTSATGAATSATTATTQAATATTQATNAAASATSAAASLTAFTNTYLGAFSADPSGSPVSVGDLYFNTVSNRVLVYSGTAWSYVAIDASILVSKDSATGSAILPAGTTGERTVTGVTNGMLRYNTTIAGFEGYVAGTWGGVGGAQANGAIYENAQSVTTSYTLTTSKNGFSVGPITLGSGVVVTVPSGSRWVVL